MSALLQQVQELLSEHYASFSYGIAKGCRCGGCRVYMIAIDDKVFEDEQFAYVVSEAWSYACGKESTNA